MIFRGYFFCNQRNISLSPIGGHCQPYCKTISACQKNSGYRHVKEFSSFIRKIQITKTEGNYHYFLDIPPSSPVETFQVQFESTLGINTMSLPREKWDTWDPTLISEVKDTQCLFSTDLTLTCSAGTVCCRQHLLLPEAGLHLLCQPLPWSPPGQP